MNLNASQASLLVHRLQERIKIHRDVEVVLIPTALTLQPMSMQIDRRKFRLGAQNAHFHDGGAYTGEVSMTMLHDLVHYVLVGHSERRHKFGERDEDTGHKVAAALRNEIMPILCIGETKHEKLEGHTTRVIHDQLAAGLKNVSTGELSKIVIAYEPVWAISDGKNYAGHESAKPTEVAKVVKKIRRDLEHMFGPRVAKKVRILYGGSVTADTARGYLEVPGIEGLLVGGASLNYHQFSDIVDAAYRLSQERADG